MRKIADPLARTACAFVFAAADDAATGQKTKPRHFKPRFWLGLVIAAIVLCVPATAQAENVAPNPGFEQPGCATFPHMWGGIICDWGTVGRSVINRDTNNPRTGDASMLITCIVCDSGPGVSAGSSCIPIAPGAHPASFWYRLSDSIPILNFVGLGADFHVTDNCGDIEPDQDFFGTYESSPDGAWHEVTGSLFARVNVRSVDFWLFAQPVCAHCGFWRTTVWFDDFVVEEVAGLAPMPALPKDGAKSRRARS